jgi:hypothetical protein
MIMTSGIMNTTQSENITSPQNNLKSPNTSMHRVQQRRSRVPIYTNCEGDTVDLREDDDGDVAVDDKDGTSLHAKGVQVIMKVSNSPRQQPRCSRIGTLPEKKRTFASTVSGAGDNSVNVVIDKIMVYCAQHSARQK